MTTLNSNGSYRIAEPIETTRTFDTRSAQIERRMTKVVEGQIAVLRDATVDYIAAELKPLRDDIAALIQLAYTLEQKLAEKTAVDQQVAAIAAQLEERAARRDAAKRGPQGLRGERGAKGDRGARGPAGARGATGRPAKDRPTIIAFKNSPNSYQIICYLSDGQPGPVIDLYPLLQRMLIETGGYYG